MEHPLFFLLFNLSVLVLLLADLFVFHRKATVVTVRSALLWSGFWILLAMGLGVLIYYQHPRGEQAAMEYLAGYLIEKSLSVDNLFVFLLLFTAFKLPGQYQHRVLFWGVLGAIVMRVVFIYTGVELMQRVSWLIYVFGGILVFSGLKLLKDSGEPHIDLETNWVLRLMRRLFRVSNDYDGGKFFTHKNGLRYATPLLLVLVLIEVSDLIFAVDSIPAVLAVSDDFIIIYTSNIMAILGLRSLYFALAGIWRYFHYLSYGLAAILVFVGAKMLLAHTEYKVPITWSLVTIGGLLAVSVGASLLFPPKGKKLPVATEPDHKPEEDLISLK